LAANPQREEMKMYVTCEALRFRRAHAELFSHGEYLPVWASGDRAMHVGALARHWQGHWIMAVFPRWLARMECQPPSVAAGAWGRTELVLPAGAPAAWTNLFTGGSPDSMQVPELLRDFPVALLEGR
jgi:(1->4)-alpha-D-glucan 1-alpha-D-glucosylmutase